MRDGLWNELSVYLVTRHLFTLDEPSGPISEQARRKGLGSSQIFKSAWALLAFGLWTLDSSDKSILWKSSAISLKTWLFADFFKPCVLSRSAYFFSRQLEQAQKVFKLFSVHMRVYVCFSLSGLVRTGRCLARLLRHLKFIVYQKQALASFNEV